MKKIFRKIFSIKDLDNNKSNKLITIFGLKFIYYGYISRSQRCYKKTLKQLKKELKFRKLNITFMVGLSSFFPARALLDYLLKNGACNVKILLLRDLRFDEKLYHKTYEELILSYPKGIIVKAPLNNTEDNIDLKSFTDIMFCPLPYPNCFGNKYNADELAKNGILTVLSNYGYFRSQYDKTIIESVEYSSYWKVFLESFHIMDLCKKYQIIKGKNCEVVGYCKMDNYKNAKNVNDKNYKKTIIIAPHHSVIGGYNRTMHLSNFFKYAELFLKLPDIYPDVKFIFRPHPALFACLSQDNFWGKNKVDDYVMEMKKKKNVVYSDNGNYFAEFAQSDGIIDDCGSFLVEYFYTYKPQCYMLKSQEGLDEIFLPFGKECLEHCYKAFSDKDIIYFIDNVILGEVDIMKNDREKFANEKVMLNYPNVSKKIYEYISIELGIGK